MSIRTYVLMKVETPSDWDAYHAIRRDVLFEARGQYDYNPDLPDERRPENLPLLLKQGCMPLGTVRLDRQPDDVAIVRLVAVRTEHQGFGHGTALLEALEQIARNLGIRELRVHAAADAEGFYLKHGYARTLFDPGSRGGGVQMLKRLSPRQ